MRCGCETRYESKMFLGILAMLTREVSGGDGGGAGPWQAAPWSRCGESTRRRCGCDGPAIPSDWDGGGDPPGQGRRRNINTRELLGTEPRIHINPGIDGELNGAKAKVPIFVICLVG